MDDKLNSLANQHRNNRVSDQSVRETIRELYQRYIKKNEQALLDAAAAATAVNAIFLTDQIDMSQVTPQMAEAFNLAYPNVDLSSLVGRSPDEIGGFLSAWKGKYFEVLVRDKLNAGEWVGDIHLEPGQTAMLAESATQPGWDLQIINSDGSIAQELQLKATESLSYVKEALERYPDIDVLTTDEVGDAAENIFSSGFSDKALEDTIRAPMEDLLDKPIEELLENVLPGLPFALIAIGEGRQVLMGRKTFDIAMKDGLSRAVKSGAAIGAGALVAFLDGGLLSIPASFLTRLGIDRYQTMGRSVLLLDRRIESLHSLESSSLYAKASS